MKGWPLGSHKKSQIDLQVHHRIKTCVSGPLYFPVTTLLVHSVPLVPLGHPISIPPEQINKRTISTLRKYLMYWKLLWSLLYIFSLVPIIRVRWRYHSETSVPFHHSGRTNNSFFTVFLRFRPEFKGPLSRRNNKGDYRRNREITYLHNVFHWDLRRLEIRPNRGWKHKS